MLRASGSTAEPVPLAEWRAEVERKYSPPDRRPSTCHRVRQAVRDACKLAGPGATTADLTAGLVARYAEQLGRRPIRAETATGLLRGLRAACSLAVENGWLDFGPFLDWADWPERDEEPLKSRAHPRADVARVLGHLRERSGTWEGGRIHALANVWAYAGLRLAESVRLHPGDLDFTSRTVIVRRHGRKLKTKASASAVPMPDALAEALAGWLPRVEGSPWVFPGTKRLGPWSGGKYGSRPGEAIRLAAEEVGVRGMTPHTLRHSLATHLRAHWGLSPKQLQMVLRHSNLLTQELYCQREMADLVERIKGIDFAA